MPTKILTVPYPNGEHLAFQKYLKIKEIQFQYYDVWDFSNGSRFVFPDEECLLILPYFIFYDVSDPDTFIDDMNASKCSVYWIQIRDIVQYRNYKKYIDKITIPCYLHVEHYKSLHQPDNRIVSTDICNTSCLENLYIDTNHERNVDFLFITITKPDRPHRGLLVDKLKEKNLLQKSIGKIDNKKTYDKNDVVNSIEKEPNWKDNFVGTVAGNPYRGNFKDAIVYWDLYNRVYYEVICETYHDFSSYPTEKTMKSIVAKVPFVLLSDYKFYDYFKSLGFKTFGNVIDESFAYEPDLNTRVEKMVNTISNINAKEFYEKTRDICEHNYKNLCYLHYHRHNELSKQWDKLFTELEIC